MLLPRYTSLPFYSFLRYYYFSRSLSRPIYFLLLLFCLFLHGMMQEIQGRPCYDRGNGWPFCSPMASDTWYKGSNYEFVWNYNYPYYVASEYINLFLYYKENHAFQPIKNWTNVHRADGHLAVQVDDTWFPSQLDPSSSNRTWSIFGFYLPAGKDPASELTNPESQYPRPFNFSVVQSSYPTNHPAQQPNDGSTGGGLPAWAVTVIAFGLLFGGAVAACLFVIRRRRKQPNNTMVVIPAPTHTKQMSEMDSSIYSTTPIIVGTTASNSSTPRLSNQFYNNSSSRRSSGMMPNRSGLTNCRSSGSFDDTSSRRLADSTFMWMVDSPDNEEDEQRRRKLGEALLAQQLQDEEGASVKHAERRPITVNDGVSGQESHAVFEER